MYLGVKLCEVAFYPLDLIYKGYVIIPNLEPTSSANNYLEI